MRSFQITVFLLVTLATPAVFSSISGLDSLIIVAVKTGDGPAIANCLKKGVDINAKIGEEECTLLAYSIVEGQTDISKFLIQHGADVEKFSDRKTPLMFAAKFNRVEVVPVLIDGGADINSVNNDNNTALHY
ncbi:MAG: ankyrin repeat domain-containing protein, partial [Candidatus Heimdallarchaeota archaeon]|nr:ankyrin repeat domain-containing protein [Candidatus Heimdallarchaeota archaeon]